MLRLLLLVVIIVCMSERVFAIVELVEFQSTLTSEKNIRPATGCSWATTPTGGESLATELEDCGISLARQFSYQNRGDFRLRPKVWSHYGWSSLLFTRRMAPPLGGTERPREGVGIVTSLSIHPGQGAATGSMSFSLVERLLPPKGDSEPARLSLDLLGESLNNFSTASVQVFDHDTDELLLSWLNDGEPFEPNNGRWFSQELDFEDRIGHAIRFEFEAVGRTVHRSSWLSAAVFLIVPEPGSFMLAMPSLLAVGAQRQKRRRMSVSP